MAKSDEYFMEDIDYYSQVRVGESLRWSAEKLADNWAG